MHHRASILVFLLSSTLARSALAYSDTSAFSRDPSADTAGGGGGIYFTGSPRSHGLDCAVCHINGPSDGGLVLSALTASERARLFETGYEPGVVYEIEVAFDEDRLGDTPACRLDDQEPCNLNLFAFEILDDEGRPAGTLCPVRPNPGVAGEGCAACPVTRADGTQAESSCSVIVADGFDPNNFRWRNGTSAYSFFWRAPAADIGLLHTYVSAVDGRGPEVEDGEITSFTSDGVVTIVQPVFSPTIRALPSNCTTAPGQPDMVVWLLLVMVGLRLRMTTDAPANPRRRGTRSRRV